VVEHPLGKGEVRSSILRGSTIFLSCIARITTQSGAGWHTSAPPRIRDEAERCILLCKQPFAPGEDLAAIFTDIDHAILGASRSSYMAYASAVIAEYTTLFPLEAVYHGQADFLRTQLAQPRIFRTRWHDNMLGEIARENMRAELRFLG